MAVRDFLGASMTLGRNHCRLLAGQWLPIALKKLAVFDPPKNFEKLLEFHYVTEEPTFTTLGAASHCYIGLFQPWSKELSSVPVFASCDQLAKVLTLGRKCWTRSSR